MANFFVREVVGGRRTPLDVTQKGDRRRSDLIVPIADHIGHTTIETDDVMAIVCGARECNIGRAAEADSCQHVDTC